MTDVANYYWLAAPSPVLPVGTISLIGGGNVNGLTVPERVRLTITATVIDVPYPYTEYVHNGDPIFLAFPNGEFGVKVGRPSEEWPDGYPSGGEEPVWDEGAAVTGIYALNDVMHAEGGYWEGAPFSIVRLPCWTIVMMRPEIFTSGTETALDLIWTLDTAVGSEIPTTSSTPVVVGPKGDGAVPQLVQLPVGSAGGAGPYSKAMLVALAAKHGAADPNLAAAVALAESGGNPLAANTANTDGSRDDGLWQINSIHGYDPDWLHDPDNNAEAMMAISSGGTDWTPWVTYNSGAYLAFL